MVDTFRHFYPTAEARFTCWYQFTNTRYSNDGTRIDYTLVDRSLLPFVKQGGNLRTGKSPQALQNSENDTIVDPLTEEAALAAATARGNFQPVSFEGGGIVEATQQTLDTQFGPRHTGMIYTPPSFSDHIAVSVLLEDDGDNECKTAENSTIIHRHWRADNWGTLVLDEKDPATKRSQPQKAQKSIASFFSNNNNINGGTDKVPGKSTASARTRLPQKRPATMRSFFQPMETSTDNRSQNIAPNPMQRQKSSSENEHRVKSKGSTAKTTTLAKTKKPGAPSILHHFAKK